MITDAPPSQTQLKKELPAPPMELPLNLNALALLNTSSGNPQVPENPFSQGTDRNDLMLAYLEQILKQ